MTWDLWSDLYTRINYLGVPVHYIANGKLKDHVMCMIELQTDVQKIGDNVNIEITSILSSFDLYDIDKLVFMTDGCKHCSATSSFYKAVIFSVHSEHCIGMHDMERQWGRK